MENEKKPVGRDTSEPIRSGRSCKTSASGSNDQGTENPPGFSRGECQHICAVAAKERIYDGSIYLIVIVKARDEAQVKKIAQDRRAEYLAKKEGVV